MKILKYLIMLSALMIVQIINCGHINGNSLNKNVPEVKRKGTIILKVLLVEFKDVKHRNPTYPTSLSLPAYKYDDYNNLIFSKNHYCSPNIYSPDGKEVFGSLSDYYRIMSNNKLNITGFVLNKDSDNDNIPDWILLDSSKSYYHCNRGKEFREESRAKAKSIGLDISTNSKVFLVIIYSGHTYRSKINTLTPEAFPHNNEYIMGERFAPGSPYQNERDDSLSFSISHFSQIGIHAHEFGHLIGLMDHSGPSDNYNWDLMSSGVFNGPNNSGACPAPINPYDRSRLGWLGIIRFGDSTQVKMRYDLISPHIYYMEDPKTFDFFLVEFRDCNSNMTLGNFRIPDYNSHIKNMKDNNGLLVWRKIKNYNVKLLHSCGKKCSNTNHQLFPGEQNVRVLTPWSDNRDPRFGDFWIPNTKPGNNCGLEIRSVENNYYLVDLYQKNPWYASPSKVIGIVNNSDKPSTINWELKHEPDLAFYKIYKMNSDSSYSLYDITSENNYTDDKLYNDLRIEDSCFVCYKITAYDLDNKESIRSKEIKIHLTEDLTSAAKNDQTINNDFILSQNYPNPFNPSTVIKYTIPSNVKSEKANVKLVVYNILGKVIEVLVNEKQTPGNYEVNFNANNLSSGVYFYNLQVGDFTETKKMILLR